MFGLRPDLSVLLVFGGSQGAKSLNRALAGAIGALLGAGVQVLHVTGPRNSTEVQAPPGPVPYVAVPYVDRMDLAYAAADFALCRAGAMTCAELTAVGLPAAYVPLPIGNGEQRLNAMPIVARGGGLLVEDAELTAEWIIDSLLPVLTNIDQVAAMSEAAAALGRKDADRWLAEAVINIVAGTANRAQAAPPAPEPDRPRPASPPGDLFTPAAARRPQTTARPSPAPGGSYPPPAAQPPADRPAPGRGRHAR
jgi:UDP-N-acetylglucosamine--N-acetylmuramyl-(pentapeptide) pyrophosphoryl-undecaprenol N-acetylglucosamine transferase